MDDYSSNTLSDSKNEWSIILMNHLTPHIIDGFRSIFNESVQLCTDNDEEEKYLMTFQNLLARIPKWNQTIIDTEQTRSSTLCNCSYVADNFKCVHIIQLKILSCLRVGSETKKVTIDIPDFSAFIHQTYTNIARKLYSNIYLFEIDIQPLETQKRNREFEHIVQTCIMNTIRDRIPIETLLRQYIDETQEQEVVKVEKVVKAEPVKENVPEIKPVERREIEREREMIEPIEKKEPTFQELNEVLDKPETPRIKFSDNDSVLTFETPVEPISLGEITPIEDFEVLDLTGGGDKVDLQFEEL